MEWLECLIAKPSKGSAGKTGLWRTFKPIYKAENCKKCLLCVLYCPESVIEYKNGEITIDYEFCKGCGVCMSVCNYNAIEMVKED